VTPSGPFVLRLLFVRSSGNLRQPSSVAGVLQSFVWLSAAAFPRFAASGAVSEVEDGRVRSIAPAEEAVRSLLALADAAGLTSRKCRVTARVDTSDLWSVNLLRIDLDGKTTTLDLQLMATGFEGPDAVAVRDFFKRLLDLAGILDESTRRDLTE
jgi:hypothetical protein